MSSIYRLYKKENYKIQKIINLEDKLYTRLKEIIEKEYDGTISDIVNICIEDLVEKNNINYDKLITECNNKLLVCKENNIDIFIDDKIETCLELQNGGITSFIMNTPFNNQLDEKNVVRVFSWVDLYYKIQEVKNSI